MMVHCRLAIEIGPEENLIEDEEVYEVPIPTPSPPHSLLHVETHNSTHSPLSSPAKKKFGEHFVEISQDGDGDEAPPAHPGDDDPAAAPAAAAVLSTPVSSKLTLWQSISEDHTVDSIDSHHSNSSRSETPPSTHHHSHLHHLQHQSQMTSGGGGDRENIFSPQEVRKRSSSMKKVGGSTTEISVITRTTSHGISFSTEDIPSSSFSSSSPSGAASSRSPEFSLNARNRSQSERGFPSKQLRRLSSGARLEGAAMAAVELARLDGFIESPLRGNGSPLLSSDGKKSRRSSTAGTYVRSVVSSATRDPHPLLLLLLSAVTKLM
jgi:hypothetical protein